MSSSTTPVYLYDRLAAMPSAAGKMPAANHPILVGGGPCPPPNISFYQSHGYAWCGISD